MTMASRVRASARADTAAFTSTCGRTSAPEGGWAAAGPAATAAAPRAPPVSRKQSRLERVPDAGANFTVASFIPADRIARIALRSYAGRLQFWAMARRGATGKSGGRGRPCRRIAGPGMLGGKKPLGLVIG